MKKINWWLIAIIILAAVLRLVVLDKYPVGINSDEAALGYNAYSIIKTGKDEYGEFLPMAFKSFGDYKPGLYVYFTIPFVALLGLNEWAVRLPSALLGIGTVYLIFLLSQRLFNSRGVSLLASLMLAISPWHLHFSRGGWETNAATFGIVLGVWGWLKALENPKWWWV
jgi:4-amino-4-deoxy-L-arabinose transferase-like glycosyltransferase